MFSVLDATPNVQKYLFICYRTFSAINTNSNARKYLFICCRVFSALNATPNAQKYLFICCRTFSLLDATPDAWKYLFICCRTLSALNTTHNAWKYLFTFYKAFSAFDATPDTEYNFPFLSLAKPSLPLMPLPMLKYPCLLAVECSKPPTPLIYCLTSFMASLPPDTSTPTYISFSLATYSSLPDMLFPMLLSTSYLKSLQNSYQTCSEKSWKRFTLPSRLH